MLIYRTNSNEDEDDIDTIIFELTQAATKLGSKFDAPILIGLKSINAKSWIEELKVEIGKARPLIVVSAVSDKCGALYQSLK